MFNLLLKQFQSQRQMIFQFQRFGFHGNLQKKYPPINRRPVDLPPPKHITPKPEVMPQVEKNPLLRQRPMEIPPSLFYNYMGITVPKEPQSIYTCVQHYGTTYHLFNANRIPLGRMAVDIAVALRGKYRPDYNPSVENNRDICVVVNGETARVTGRKRDLIKFRHHTGYPGSLKTITYREYLEKDPEEMIRRVVKGMLPKNGQRKNYLARLHVHRGPFHTHHAQNLPQFGFEQPHDPVALLGYDQINPKNTTVVFETNPIEELKDYEKELNPDIKWPIAQLPKTYTHNARNFKANRFARTLFRKLKKYKEHK